LPGFFVGGFDGMIEPYGVLRFVEFFYVRVRLLRGFCDGCRFALRQPPEAKAAFKMVLFGRPEARPFQNNIFSRIEFFFQNLFLKRP
jgi:hypothetical protein